MRSRTDGFATAQCSDGIAFSIERPQMSSKLPVLKRPSGVSRRPATDNQPFKQMGYKGAKTDGEAEDAVYGWVRAQAGSE